VVVVALSNRIDALERQLAEATRLAEENGNRVATLETELARMRTDLDARLRAVESSAPTTQPATAETSEAPPAEAAVTPPVRTAEATPPRPVRTGDATVDGEAAAALLAHYRGNPKGERAADSLFYLGEALVALKQPAQACKAYAELEEVYGGSMRADLQRLLPAAKTRARC
jgi:TolA-binding protein